MPWKESTRMSQRSEFVLLANGTEHLNYHVEHIFRP